MADFFTRVAERALGRQPAIQAVVPSIYTPEPRLASLATFQSAPPEPSEMDAAAEAPSPAIRAVTAEAPSPAVRATAAPPVRSEPKVPDTVSDAAVEPPERPLAKPVATERPKRAEFRPSPTLPVERRLYPEAAPAPPVDAPSPARRATETAPQVRPAVSPVDLKSAAPGTESEARTARPEIRPRRAAEAESAEPNSAADPARPQATHPPAPQPLVKAQRREEITAVPDSPAEPHTVRVTIGRVEVKAVLPATPARNAPPLPKRELSLDDYLKQRKAGRR